MDFTTLMEKVEELANKKLPDEAHGLISDYVSNAMKITKDGEFDRVASQYEKRLAEVRAEAQKDAQHIYHHNEPAKPRVTLDVEKNSKGFNYSAHVADCASVEEAMLFLKDALAKLEAEYGGGKQQ